ncbi:MAG: DUF1848 family protein [Candidatus Thorarchaeota archaeon]
MSLVKSPIISCSRRTDVPAFLMDWVIERLREGYVDVTNPFNVNQVSHVSLSPKDVRCFVWWSKNFKEWIKTCRNNEILFKSYKGHTFQFTINSPSELERNIQVSLEERFNQMEWLINEFSLQSINFRYDPIIFYKIKGSNSVSNNLKKFEFIIKNVANLGIREMIFSFATIYAKVRKRMNERGFIPIDPSLEKKKQILGKLLEITDKYNMQMNACCQPDLLKVNEIFQAQCIDSNKIEQLIGEKMPNLKDTGQRKDCGCSKSKDIGGYSGIFRCKHNCDYCYASPAKR